MLALSNNTFAVETIVVYDTMQLCPFYVQGSIQEYPTIY